MAFTATQYLFKGTTFTATTTATKVPSETTPRRRLRSFDGALIAMPSPWA